MNLAKSPASIIQILAAEKALFRALKTKHDTPKYGLIYHAFLVGQATGKNKEKISRMLAAKAAIGLRVDEISDWSASGEVRMITSMSRSARQSVMCFAQRSSVIFVDSRASHCCQEVLLSDQTERPHHSQASRS